MADLHFSDAEPTAAEQRAVLAALDEAAHDPEWGGSARPAAADLGAESGIGNGAASSTATMPPPPATGGTDGTGASAGSGAVMLAHPRVVRGGLNRRKQLRHLLLPTLHALQREAGWISPGGLNFVGRTLGVPPAEAYGVATFYDMFTTEAPTHERSVHHVCVDPICALGDAASLATQLRAEGHAVHEGPCLGQCERAPALFIQGRGQSDHVPADEHGEHSLLVSTTAAAPHAPSLLRSMIGSPSAAAAAQRPDEPAPTGASRGPGAGTALETALRLGPDEVIARISAAGLSGRGGAAFPTGVKWRAVADGDGPKHVVANIDESEPGTFKDRLLCERDPLAIIEAVAVAGLTVGAAHGWIYIRGEYPLATERLRDAIDDARSAGWLGDDAAGAGQPFDIELRRGAGAYICGEETALFNSLEGFRGEPRNKPPFPTTHGLFGRPTVVNNPETLLNVLEILRIGPEAYRSVGTDGSPGTKLFCLSGHVGAPGLYEAPFGTPLGELLEMAGGVTGGVGAILLGGAAGGFVGPESLDLPLSLEHTRAAGATLGSGPVMVFDDTTDFAAVIERLARFFRDESCGQCVPCRVGTVRQHELVSRIRRTGTATQRQRETARRHCLGDGRRVDLRTRPHGSVRRALSHEARPARSVSKMNPADGTASERTVALSVDGRDVAVREGESVLAACTAAGAETPTICWAPNLTPVNACRVCVVELEGSRTLVPACSRPAEEGMQISTDTERVRHSRRMVLEFLDSANDLSQAPDIAPWLQHYGADAARYGEALESGTSPERVDEPVRIQDELYIRAYDRCVLCYKCVEACGDDAQHTFAIAVAGRGFDARIRTEYDAALPDSACVYCGNCVAVCPTGALQFRTEFDLRAVGEWRPDDQSVTRTVCSYCGVGCNLDLHVQDQQIVKVTSPTDHEVTSGHLCIKGRFGWQYVHAPAYIPPGAEAAEH